ncbi:hypothetical protein PVA38_11645 [Streptococcus pneumoniae D39]|nr:hypothetical protein PVA38_11645 [Streptococcus pneumoniae D39]
MCPVAVSYTHLRAHETVLDLVCRLLLEKKNIFPLSSIPLFFQHTYHPLSFFLSLILISFIEWKMV